MGPASGRQGQAALPSRKEIEGVEITMIQIHWTWLILVPFSLQFPVHLHQVASKPLIISKLHAFWEFSERAGKGSKRPEGDELSRRSGAVCEL